MIKIAIPTSDKTSVHQRTGQATFFAVATIQDNSISHLEFRLNPPHIHNEDDHQHSHHQIIQLLEDCNVLLVKHIGKYMRHALDEAGLEYEKTSEESIGDAIRHYLSQKATIR
jgi:predicted Fe-Mo cluster-binding NifX family protein